MMPGTHCQILSGAAETPETTLIKVEDAGVKISNIQVLFVNTIPRLRKFLKLRVPKETFYAGKNSNYVSALLPVHLKARVRADVAIWYFG